jgi:hypothetical membrane protein
MAKQKKEEGSTPSLILIGGIFAVVSMLVVISCTLGAVAYYTIFPFRPLVIIGFPFLIPVLNTGYSITSQLVGELGIGPSAFLFNVGLIITGILMLPVFPGQYMIFKGSKIAMIGAVCGVIGSFGCSAIGLSPPVLSPNHIPSALVFFIFSGIAIILLSVKMFRGAFFPRVLAVYGFFFVVVDILFLVLGAEFTVTQWAVFLVIVTWILAMGVWVLAKRKEI